MSPEEFKQARLDRGLTQSEMAKFLGIKNSRSIRRYESGEWKVSERVAEIINADDNKE